MTWSVEALEVVVGVSSLNSEPGGPGFDIFALWLFRPTPQDSPFQICILEREIQDIQED